MADKVTFIILGILYRKEKLKKEILKVFYPDYQVVFKETQISISATNLAVEAISEGTDFLISVGGDGTMNEVVNGFFISKTIKEIPIGLLPYGSGNDFARTLGCNRSIFKLFEAIKKRKTIKSDAGEVSYLGFEGMIRKRIFINITDVGIGGMVSKNVNKSDKKLGAGFAYVKAILKSFLLYKHKYIRLEAENFQWEGKVLSLCLANGRYFGGGMCIAPEADIADGKMDLVLLANVSLLDYIKNVSKVKKGKKIKHPEVSYHKTSFCKITSTDKDCPIDMDGEFIGYTPLELKLMPLSVTLIKP